MGRRPDTRLLAAVVAAIVLGASAYAAIGAAVGSYPPGLLALLRMLVASAALALYAALAGPSTTSPSTRCCVTAIWTHGPG